MVHELFWKLKGQIFFRRQAFIFILINLVKMTIVNLECSSFFTMRKFDCNWPTFWFTGLWQVNFQQLSESEPCPPFANTHSPLIQNGEFCIACWNGAIFLCFFGIRSITILDCCLGSRRWNWIFIFFHDSGLAKSQPLPLVDS